MSGWNPSFSYTVGRAPQLTRRISTSGTEISHLLIAFTVLTIDFTLLDLRFFPGPLSGLLAILPVIGVAAGAATTGFILHELAHKVVAQRLGYAAEFRMAPMGLLVSLFTAYIGFLFAAPGATVVAGMGTPDDWGRTSIAGPLVNLTAAGTFLAGAFALRAVDPNSAFLLPLLILAFLNGWFGAFNLIPLGPLDGAKVLRWSKGRWVATFATALALSGLLFWLLNFPNPYF